MKLPPLKKVYLNVRNTIKSKVFIRLFIGAVMFAIMVFVLIAVDLPSAKKIEVGRPAPWDVKAARSVQVIDEDQWHKAQNLAAEQVQPVEKFEPYAATISETKIENTFRWLKDYEAAKSAPNMSKEDIEEVAARMPMELNQETVDLLLKASQPQVEQYHTTAKYLLGIIMREGVLEGHLAEAQQRVAEEAADFPALSTQHRQIATAIAQAALIANKFPDIAATQQARSKAREQVEPVMRVILPGQIVIREGDIVGDKDIPVLEALGVYKPFITSTELISYSVLVLLIIVISGVYVRIHVPRLYNDMTTMTGLAIIVALSLISSRYLTTISPYLMPIALPAMLLAILIEPRFAVLAVNMMGLYVGLETNNLPAVATTIFTGVVSILAVSKVTKRWDMVTASFLVWATNVLSVLIFSMLSRESFDDIIFDAFIYGGMNGLISSLLASGALPFLERAFKVTTHVRMLELSNPTEPVLHELLTKAPGTYQHSIMVANLAEAAAQAIGADSLLCRAGAYYHDIGKMKQPNMYVENQMGQENPHDKLAPSLSAMIVMSHVKYGQEMARQYKVPSEIAQFITEHHGTNLASFFYQKAKQQGEEPVFKEEFSYPGPKPQSKETAIVMICDGIEAASRTLQTPSKENLQNLIERMVNGIIANKQLDECNLSLKDINAVKSSILMSLTSHYHSRVVYPDAAKMKVGHAPKTDRPSASLEAIPAVAPAKAAAPSSPAPEPTPQPPAQTTENPPTTEATQK